jgi:hypothetical protein
MRQRQSFQRLRHLFGLCDAESSVIRGQLISYPRFFAVTLDRTRKAAPDRFSLSDYEEIMKRDMELVRNLMLILESRNDKPSWKDLTSPETEAEEETLKVLEHLKLMEEAGLIKSVIMHTAMYRLPQDIDITWSGHEFLADTRDPDVWQRAKGKAKNLTDIGVGFIWELAKAEVKLKLGL